MKTKAACLGIFGLVASLAPCRAQVATTTPPAASNQTQLSPFEQQLQDLKNPTKWLSWGGDLRVRNEYLNNTLTLNPDNPLHEQDYFRFRTRLWTSLKPIDDVSVNARLATEPREWMRPAGYTVYRGQSGFDYTEGIIDALNVQWRNIAGSPASFVIGRQDIMIGEGWLTGEGTPYDGSGTFFMDAARFSYDLKEQHTMIEAIGIMQNARDEGFLPTINNQNRYLIEQNESGAILNVVNSSLPAANLNGYFIYKKDDKIQGKNALARGDNADIYTVGLRVSGVLQNHWKYSVEGAYQMGEKQDLGIQGPEVSDEYRDIRAAGLNSKLTYMLKDRLNNQFSLNYEYLTGDDPNSKNDEMFDVLWGRYPHWGEIGLYSFAAETRVGQEANFHRFGPSWTVTPMSGLDFTAAYYAMVADQSVATRGANGLFTNDGNFRGHFASAVLKYKFSSHLAGHLWGELLFPGDYYEHRQVMSFLRAEVMLTF